MINLPYQNLFSLNDFYFLAKFTCNQLEYWLMNYFYIAARFQVIFPDETKIIFTLDTYNLLYIVMRFLTCLYISNNANVTKIN